MADLHANIKAAPVEVAEKMLDAGRPGVNVAIGGVPAPVVTRADTHDARSAELREWQGSCRWP